MPRFAFRPPAIFRRPPEPNREPDAWQDRVAQVCSWDLPGFTVVRSEAELEWVVLMVEAHAAALDEWTGDFLDAEIHARHGLRLAHIDSQAQARIQEATRALADTEEVLAALSFKVEELRAREHELTLEVRQWRRILTGEVTQFDVPVLAGSASPQCAEPLRPLGPLAEPASAGHPDAASTRNAA